MKFITVLFTLLVASNTTLAQDTWRGLIIAPENRCSPYDKKSQYPYPQSVEDIVVANMGGIVYGPYTGRIFENDRKTDIEHILSTSEGHDSGLCAASPEVRKQFAIDPLNLTLAAPEVNRCNPGGKCGFDAAEWMPEKNQCWFSNRIVEIRQKYKLTIDINEARTLENTLRNCESFEMIMFEGRPVQGDLNAISNVQVPNISLKSALTLYDDNGNGKITCKEARAHGIAPVTQDHPAYQYMYDPDKDGVVCE
ncbi:excalibur calcium-binding domain-containing protein (plasmid) [Alteromonas macleodii]|uniref:excalibur calcium-binding domain-containing protein n=1 Tax=Alteromonas macleodii TaxID=28108 RepID=UPI000ED5F2B6|nr:hypothetical protein [Pseudoalteromonas sp.]